MNPAQELLLLLDQWKSVPKGSGIQGVRSGTATPDEDFTHQQIRAGWLLGETERAITALERSGEDMSAFRTFLPKWWNAIVLPNEKWNENAQNAKVAIGPDTLAMLSAFGAYLSKSSLKPFQADPVTLNSSRAAVDEILDTLGEQDDLGADTRTYVFALADEIRTLLDATDARIDVDLIRRIHELRGWLAEYEAYLEDKAPGNPVAKKLRRAARALMPGTKIAFGVTGYALGVVADTLALTQGG